MGRLTLSAKLEPGDFVELGDLVSDFDDLDMANFMPSIGE